MIQKEGKTTVQKKKRRLLREGKGRKKTWIVQVQKKGKRMERKTRKQKKKRKMPALWAQGELRERRHGQTTEQRTH
jgi:hypothetical protein